MPHAECEVDTRIGIDVTQRQGACQVRTGQRSVDFGYFDRRLGTLQYAVESQGHVCRVAELWFIAGLVRQRREACTARTDVEVEMERIGAGPKIHVAVRDTAHDERMTFAPHLEQTIDVEPLRLDFPHLAHRICLLAYCQAGLRLYQSELEIPGANTRHIPGCFWRADSEACRADKIGRTNGESQPAGVRGCDRVGMQPQSMADVEIEARKAQEWPDAYPHRTDPGNHSMAQGCGLDLLANLALERGFQKRRRQGQDQRCGDRSCQPCSPANTQPMHRYRMP
ncbi:MAG: hypothetical protein K0Q92_3081 [Steroidobacteraceae bacterium]|nr:hypothetical protein [Steroidobacteraceae bacterium]